MGWEEAIRSYEGRIAGICGGYQMLGKRICDPYGVEGEAGESAGLGLLDCVSVLGKAKRLTRVRGWVPMFEATVAGYEIHVGRTFGGDEGRVFARIRVEGDSVDMDDGWMEDCGRVFGTYIHGLLDAPSCSAAFVEWATAGAVKREDVGTASKGSRDTEYGKLAAHLADHIDMERCLAILDGGVEAPRPRRCVGPPSTAV